MQDETFAQTFYFEDLHDLYRFCEYPEVDYPSEEDVEQMAKVFDRDYDDLSYDCIDVDYTYA